jgi:hypothetical protein
MADYDGPALAAIARAELKSYLQQTGLGGPADAVQQFQVTLLQQWTDHLAVVLEAEDVPSRIALRVLRGVIWGCAPGRSEQVIRMQMTAEMLRLHETAGIPPW